MLTHISQNKRMCVLSVFFNKLRRQTVPLPYPRSRPENEWECLGGRLRGWTLTSTCSDHSSSWKPRSAARRSCCRPSAADPSRSPSSAQSYRVYPVSDGRCLYRRRSLDGRLPLCFRTSTCARRQPGRRRAPRVCSVRRRRFAGSAVRSPEIPGRNERKGVGFKLSSTARRHMSREKHAHNQCDCTLAKFVLNSLSLSYSLSLLLFVCLSVCLSVSHYIFLGLSVALSLSLSLSLLLSLFFFSLSVYLCVCLSLTISFSVFL